MADRTFAMDLTPSGASSCILMDGHDISRMIRGVVVRASVNTATEVELLPGYGMSAELMVRLPEARIAVAVDVVEAVKRLQPFLTHGSTCELGLCLCGLDAQLMALIGRRSLP